MKTFVAFLFSAVIGGFSGYIAGLLIGSTFGWFTAALMFLFALEVMYKGFEGRNDD